MGGGWEVGMGEDLKSSKKPQVYLLREDDDNGEMRKSEDQKSIRFPALGGVNLALAICPFSSQSSSSSSS